MDLSLSHIFRIGLGLTLACLLFSNAALAGKRIQGVPDFRGETVIRKSTPSMTMYDFEYSKSSYLYSSYRPARKSSASSVASAKSLPKKSRPEKEFPSLPILVENEKTKESVVREKTGKKSLETRTEDQLEVLSTEDEIHDVVQIMEQLEEPSLIAAQPFEKIALHFDEVSTQEEMPRNEEAKAKKVETIVMGTISDTRNDQSRNTDVLELELTPPQVDEKMSTEEIDFDSVMSVFGEIFIATIQNSRIWQLQDKLLDLSSAFNHIAGNTFR